MTQDLESELLMRISVFRLLIKTESRETFWPSRCARNMQIDYDAVESNSIRSL